MFYFHHYILLIFKKKHYGPFLWMGFNCLKATATSMGQCSFPHFQMIVLFLPLESLHLKNCSNNTFLCWKTKSPIFYFLKRKKLKFVQINLLVEILFVCVYVCLKQKNIFSYTFDLGGRVRDKKFSPGRYPETRLLFLA